MKRAISRSTRLSQIESLLISHPDGLRKCELAEKLDVSRATIGRDIDDLSMQFPIIEDDKGILSVDKKSFLNTVQLDAGEIQAIHIACRLLARNIHFSYPSAASALRKLGSTVEKYRFGFSEAIIRSAELFDCNRSGVHFNYSSFLETLTEAMVLQKTVKIIYFSRRKNRLDAQIFHPYQIEPYAEGNSLHVIGYAPAKDKILNFKFENINSIELTDENYKILEDFDADTFFKDAWGIWLKDIESEIVELHFSGKVKKRVLATVWHRCEERYEDSNGSLVWKCRISAPEEMVPWIRGWGSDVKVVSPGWLKKQIAGDAEKTVQLYRDLNLTDSE